MMKTKLLTLVNSSVLCVLFTLNIVLAQNKVDPFREIINLGNDCKKTKEIGYRSPKLTAPNEKISVYFEGILRNSSCKNYPISEANTPVKTMIVNREGKTTKITLQPEKCHQTYQPISFSPNNRYLIVEMDYGCGPTETSTNLEIIDTQNSYKKLPLEICKNASFGSSYLGYISSSKILVGCLVGGYVEYQIINLSDQSISKVSDSFAKSVKKQKVYGTISGEMTITKKRVF